MKLLKIMILLLYLVILLDLITSRKKRKKFVTDSKNKNEKKRNKKDDCQDRCTQLCIKETEGGVLCDHGMCFPSGLPVCYCWYFDQSGHRINCENVKLV